MVKNISFIVIAKNEEFTIRKCLESISKLSMENCELICVDSDSKDKTLDIMESFEKKIKNIFIFKIQGDCNAAIARNIGIKYSSKKYFFFIDGDIEINNNFVNAAISKIENSNISAVVGQLDEIQYTYKNNNYHIKKRIYDRYSIHKETNVFFSGGIFIVLKKTVDEIGKFDESLTIGEDIDYTLRITKAHSMLFLAVPMGVHHTIPYEDKTRLKSSIGNQHFTYTGRALRKNISHWKGILSFFRRYSGISTGILFYILCSFLIFLDYKALIYMPVIIIADLLYGHKKKKPIIFRFIVHYIYPLIMLKGFLFFKNADLNYRHIKILGKKV